MERQLCGLVEVSSHVPTQCNDTVPIYDSPNLRNQLRHSLRIKRTVAWDELTQRGFDHFIHNQSATALAMFRACEDWCVTLGYQAVVLWEGRGGVKKDRRGARQAATTAVDWLDRMVKRGDHHSQFVLGYLCYHGLGVDQDVNKAAALFAKAAGQGNAAAQCSLGYCYRSGEGVHRNNRKAAALYTNAAEQEHAMAQNNLGFCYQNGTGVDKDERKAAALYTKAAGQSNAPAQYNLGWCYEHGRGVDRDVEQAKHFYRLAAAQGDGSAKRALARLQ